MDLFSAKAIAATNGWLNLTVPAFREAVLDRSQLLSAAAGEVIYQVGDPPGGIYGLISGSLAVSIAPGENGPYLAHFVQPGTWVGEGAAVMDRPRQVGLVALRACVLLHLPLHGLKEIVQKDPAAWRFIALLTALHLEVAIGAADDLMIRDHVHRFIATLMRLAGCRAADSARDGPFDVHINQSDLAHLANITRTTAGSILRSLAGKGHIEVSYRHIRILAPDALGSILSQD